ncbi:MAG: MFS transporter [Halieaceae bacterium]|nr:MFS transporter [Halieaceae bacterium]
MLDTKIAMAEERASFDAWYGLAVLFIGYTVSFIDRTILSLLVEPIKTALDLSDTQVSLLHGLAFAIFYTLLGIPIARLADRHSRKYIISVGIFVWSMMTAVCGLADRFSTLFLARVGVGVGEAALSPAAYSMLADMFPKKQLGLALSLYSAGVYVGAGLAFIIGGLAVQLALDMGAVTLPFVGHVDSWRLIFFIVGLPGVFVALLMLTVKEPIRRNSQAAHRNDSGLLTVFRFIGTDPSTFLLHFVGYSLLGLVFNAFIAWAPTYFIRVHSLTAGDIGPLLGGLIFVFGGSGMIFGGVYSDLLRDRGVPAAPLVSSRLAGICLLPICLAIPIAGSVWVSCLFFAAFFFFAAFPFGAAAAAIQLATPTRLRAQMSAVYLFVLNLAGIGFGPTLVALITDYGFDDTSRVGWSLAIVGAIAAPLGAVALHFAIKPFAETVKLREQEGYC